jgi:hypothetical protein
MLVRPRTIPDARPDAAPTRPDGTARNRLSTQDAGRPAGRFRVREGPAVTRWGVH